MRQGIFRTVVALLAGALLSPWTPAFAQAPGYAEILTPAGGDSLDGLVSIEGTADHPSFLRYDLAFAYDPNPTDTWYPLGEPVPTRAQQGTLGLWDVSDLSPGTYQLRLRVHLEGGAILEDTVRGLRIGLPALAAVPTSRPAVPTALPTSTSPADGHVPSAPPTSRAPSPDPVAVAVIIGGVTAAAFLVLLALYMPLRRSLAEWAGTMRMRRILRQDQRRRTRGGG
jgi:hypothetical protein